MTPDVEIVVPTIGASSLFGPALEALFASAGAVRLGLVVVHQGGAPMQLPRVLGTAQEIGGLLSTSGGVRVRVLRLERPVGFAAAVNAGFRQTTAPLIGTVNDDVVVEPDWLRHLTDLLAREPQAGATQGVNLQPDDRVDGAGLAFNRWHQAVQLSRDGVPPARDEPPRRVFGVSATAVLYRRAALAVVTSASGAVFDARLGSYYEDVDLACRLAAAGWQSWLVPKARTTHAGSLTGGSNRRRHTALVHGNRWPVLAAWLGRSFWGAAPRMAVRDAADLAQALGRGDLQTASGVLTGWGRALRLLPGFVHARRPAWAAAERRRFSSEAAG